MGAFAIGIAAGIVCYWGCTGLKHMFGYDDALDCVRRARASAAPPAPSSPACSRSANTAAPPACIEGNGGQVVNQLDRRRHRLRLRRHRDADHPQDHRHGRSACASARTSSAKVSTSRCTARRSSNQWTRPGGDPARLNVRGPGSSRGLYFFFAARGRKSFAPGDWLASGLKPETEPLRQSAIWTTAALSRYAIFSVRKREQRGGNPWCVTVFSLPLSPHLACPRPASLRKRRSRSASSCR